MLLYFILTVCAPVAGKSSFIQLGYKQSKSKLYTWELASHAKMCYLRFSQHTGYSSDGQLEKVEMENGNGNA